MKNKKDIVVANLASDADFKRLRNWLNKGDSPEGSCLELHLRAGNLLVITNDGK